MSNFITLKEAATLTGKSISTIRKHIDKGHIPCEKIEGKKGKKKYTLSVKIDKEKLLDFYGRGTTGEHTGGTTAPTAHNLSGVDANITDAKTDIGVHTGVTTNTKHRITSVSEPQITEEKIKDIVNTMVTTGVTTVVNYHREQLQTKDKQIDDLSKKVDELTKTINNMVERDRETNILLKGLQDKLIMLEPPEPISDPAVVQKTPEPTKQQNIIHRLFTWFVKN